MQRLQDLVDRLEEVQAEVKEQEAENAELQNQVGNLIDENIVDESVNSIE